LWSLFCFTNALAPAACSTQRIWQTRSPIVEQEPAMANWTPDELTPGSCSTPQTPQFGHTTQFRGEVCASYNAKGSLAVGFGWVILEAKPTPAFTKASVELVLLTDAVAVNWGDWTTLNHGTRWLRLSRIAYGHMQLPGHCLLSLLCSNQVSAQGTFLYSVRYLAYQLRIFLHISTPYLALTALVHVFPPSSGPNQDLIGPWWQRRGAFHQSSGPPHPAKISGLIEDTAAPGQRSPSRGPSRN
jgi:hypothetical protein